MMGGGMGTGMFHGATRGPADEEIFGRVYDQRVVRRMLPYLLPY